MLELLRQWTRNIFTIGLAMAVLPWLFYGPMALYGIPYASQRGQSVELLLIGAVFSAGLALSFVLLRNER